MDILVCLEGSASTASAIDLAIELARSLPAALVGLAIVDEPDIVAGAPTSIGGASFRKDRDAALLEDAHLRAREWLDDFVARGRAAGVAARALELAGRPAELILDEVPKHDLTLLGRHVNFRFETQDRDRYTRDRILRRAGKPIIVVPEAPVAGPAAMIAYDGSAAATRALRSFAASGLARDRNLHVATVDDDGAVAFEMASRGCDLLRREFGLPAEPENVVSTESTTEALLSRRAKLGAGLVVLGGYVPSPLARLVWGSVTHELLERTVVPIFLHY